MNELFDTTLAEWGFSLTSIQRDQFSRYAVLLREWNERLNLTTIVDEQGIIVRHFLDSLICARYWGNSPTSLIDIGAGAGFPGLPLKILVPSLRLTLVESIDKKAAFLRAVAAELGLTHVSVVVDRAEVVGRAPEHREQYDVAVARAVADMRVLAEYCLPLCRVGGRFLAPKGGQADDELTLAATAIQTLGGQLVAVASVSLPGVEPRLLAVIDKMSSTPERFPRAVGIPSKRPL